MSVRVECGAVVVMVGQRFWGASQRKWECFEKAMKEVVEWAEWRRVRKKAVQRQRRASRFIAGVVGKLLI